MGASRRTDLADPSVVEFVWVVGSSEFLFLRLSMVAFLACCSSNSGYGDAGVFLNGLQVFYVHTLRSNRWRMGNVS